MTEQRTNPPEAERKAARRIPPLAWIVVAILAAWLIIAMIQRGGTHKTPQGGTMPEAAEAPAIMPAAPGGSGAPATPAGTVNGPAQPAAQ